MACALLLSVVYACVVVVHSSDDGPIISLMNPPRGGLQVESVFWGASDDWCGRLRGSRKCKDCGVIIYENKI